MGLRTIKQEVLANVNIEQLLRHHNRFDLSQAFDVSVEYIEKVRTLQKIQAEIKVDSLSYDDEMRLGRVGAWMHSKERNVYQKIKDQLQNGNT